MFTGIVEATGRIAAIERRDNGCRFAIEHVAGDIALAASRTGDSISVAGVCLTMIEPGESGFSADISAETLGATTLGGKRSGDLVNLELAVRAGDRLGGHLVSGHVDAPIRLMSRLSEGDSERFELELPERLARFVNRKGSVCLDGVSLTVNKVSSETFSVCIIPHTLEATTLGGLAEGEHLNLEVDMIARYLERLIQERQR